MVTAKRILIVDNDPDILEVLYQALTFEGFEVFTLKHTNDIISSLTEYQVDLLLIDYILDGINGGELCHQVKTNSATAHVPVIMMSAYSKVLISLGFYGCNVFIPKPFDLKGLVESISEEICKAENIKIINHV